MDAAAGISVSSPDTDSMHISVWTQQFNTLKMHLNRGFNIHPHAMQPLEPKQIRIRCLCVIKWRRDT